MTSPPPGISVESNGPPLRTWLLPAAGAGLVAAIMATLAAVYGGGWSALIDIVLTFLPAAMTAGAWLAAACGFGWPLRTLLWRNDKGNGWLVQITLGAAALMWVDAALGRLGALQIAGAGGAYALTAAGIVLLMVQLRQRFAGRSIAPHEMSPLWLASAPAAAVLLLAACSAPGRLWATEFGGYDALSYHLQLPKEWMTLGGIAPLEHNVYSFLPGYVEAAFYHLMVLRGDAIGAAEACQILHASFALITMLVIGAFVRRAIGQDEVSGGATAGIIAAILFIGTPWIIVCGSLAYNDVAVVMLLAGGLLVLSAREPSGAAHMRTGTALGVVIGIACACKLTASGFVALPLAIVALSMTRLRDWHRLLLPMFGAALIAGTPYLIGNWLASGNPVFPFATELFGSAHWTSEQVAVWNSAHAPPGGVGDRLAAAWNQLLRFGLGAPPDASEPWAPQWSILPWIGIAGLIISINDIRTRQWGIRLTVILIVQLAFWLLMTHIKSRFMLPGAVSMAAGAALGTWALMSKAPRAPQMKQHDLRAAVIAAALFIWCGVPVWIYTQERGGEPAARIGWTRMITGEAFTDIEIARAAEAGTLPTTVLVNELLPRGSRVLFLGEAAPFYYLTDRIRFDYQTTFDRGPMSQAIRAAPFDHAAWFSALRRMGYTHMLIDPNMLSRWENAGWADPSLRTDEIMNAAVTHGQVEYRHPAGAIIVRLAP